MKLVNFDVTCASKWLHVVQLEYLNISCFVYFSLKRKDEYNSEEFSESGIDHDFVRIAYEIVLTLVIYEYLFDLNNYIFA